MARTNYWTNPSFETDTNADGTADGTDVWGTCSNRAFSRVSALGSNGSYAQRVAATFTAGDSIEAGMRITTGVGTFAEGETVTVSFLARVNSATGCSCFFKCQARTAADVYAGSTDVFGLSGGTTRYSVTYSNLPANTSRVNVAIYATLFGAGDSFSLDVDDVLIEKSATATTYFDGSYLHCGWDGTAHASTSHDGDQYMTFGRFW